MSRLYPLFALPLAAGLAAGIASGQTTCEQLKLSLPDTTVTSIQFVPAGPFAAPGGGTAPAAATPVPAAPAGRGGGRGPAAPAAGGRGAAQPAASVPAYCRVLMVLTPSADSHIEAA